MIRNINITTTPLTNFLGSLLWLCFLCLTLSTQAQNQAGNILFSAEAMPEYSDAERLIHRVNLNDPLYMRVYSNSDSVVYKQLNTRELQIQRINHGGTLPEGEPAVFYYRLLINGHQAAIAEEIHFIPKGKSPLFWDKWIIEPQVKNADTYKQSSINYRYSDIVRHHLQEGTYEIRIEVHAGEYKPGVKKPMVASGGFTLSFTKAEQEKFAKERGPQEGANQARANYYRLFGLVEDENYEKFERITFSLENKCKSKFDYYINGALGSLPAHEERTVTYPVGTMIWSVKKGEKSEKLHTVSEEDASGIIVLCQ